MTALYLVRHGATDAIGHTYSGRLPGIDLNAEGRKQVQFLAEKLRNQPIQAIFCSPSDRARQTAGVIAAEYGLRVEERSALDEVDVGTWTGARFDELSRNADFGRYNSVRSLSRPPQGELMLEVQSRVVPELLRIAELHTDQSIVVVSHADVIRSALAYFLGIPIDLAHRLEISLASISIVHLSRDLVRVLAVNRA